MVQGRGIEPTPSTVISRYSGFISPSRTPVLPCKLGASDRDRTCTTLSCQEILSLPRLPIPATLANLAVGVRVELTMDCYIHNCFQDSRTCQCTKPTKLGGDGEIRTHGTLSGALRFQRSTLNHSVTSPNSQGTNGTVETSLRWVWASNPTLARRRFFRSNCFRHRCDLTKPGLPQRSSRLPRERTSVLSPLRSHRTAVPVWL